MHTYAPESGCSWAIEKERKTEIGKEEEQEIKSWEMEATYSGERHKQTRAGQGARGCQTL
jgi:hypothetical protein